MFASSLLRMRRDKNSTRDPALRISARIWPQPGVHGIEPQDRREEAGMDRLMIGDARLSRLEETVDTSFTAEGFFPTFDPEVMRPHLSWLAPRHYLPEPGGLVFSMHAWVVGTAPDT